MCGVKCSGFVEFRAYISVVRCLQLGFIQAPLIRGSGFVEFRGLDRTRVWGLLNSGLSAGVLELGFDSGGVAHERTR